MRRKLIVMLVTVVCICAGSATALAAPNADHASCEAIVTFPDTQEQIRDGVARDFAANARPAGFNIYSTVAPNKLPDCPAP
jgi:hypothetical protein